MGGGPGGFDITFARVGAKVRCDVLGARDVIMRDGCRTQLSSSFPIGRRLDETERVSAMQVAGAGQGRTEALTVGVEARLAGNLPSRRRDDSTLRLPEYAPPETSPQRQHRVGLRRRCKRVAKRIRSSTKIAHDGQGRKVAGLGEAWPRLLLWVFACAALVVSLIIRADGLDDRAAVRAPANQGVQETGLSLLSSIIQGRETGVYLRSGPRG